MSTARRRSSLAEPERILIIRRDNIGDLILTTPTMTLLRRRYPKAYIAAFVNSYNGPVLRGNPDLDEVFVYTKAKHLHPGGSRIGAWFEQWRRLRDIRSRRFDLAIVATPVPTRTWLRLARSTGAAHILAGVAPGGPVPRGVDVPVSIDARFEGRHAAEQTALLLAPLGIDEPPPDLTLVPDPDALAAAEAAWSGARRPRIALHISARKPPQRWPRDRWAMLARALQEHRECAYALFWSPGANDDPRHPGDDDTAAAVMADAQDLPIRAWATPTLESLIAGLATADLVICSDGGAMHIAAALGKPVVCLFGNSDPAVWRPWGVPHRVLRPDSHNVADVAVDQVLAAALGLLDKMETCPR